jgi:hypothetical protein
VVEAMACRDPGEVSPPTRPRRLGRQEEEMEEQ